MNAQEEISLEDATFATILEEFNDQLTTIVPQVKVDNEWKPVEYLPIEKRLELIPAREPAFDWETLQPFREKLKEIESKKVQCECANLCSMLRCTLKELQQYGTFNTIRMVVENRRKMQEDVKLLLDSAEENTATIHRLTMEFQDGIANAEGKIDSVTLQIGDLQNELQEIIKSNNIKRDYLEEWDKAQSYQRYLTNKMRDDKVMDDIENFIEKMKQEKRITQEVEAYFEEVIVDLLTNLKMWMEKYDTDLKTMELNVAKIKAKKSIQLEQLTTLQTEYNRKLTEIDEYKLMLVQREEDAKLLISQTQSAIKIQSWWRGILFRRKLSSFRRKRKGKPQSLCKK